MPADVAVQGNLGVAYERLAEYEHAAAAYRRAAQIQPDNYQIHHNLAGALYQLHRFDEALSEYDRTIALAPSDLRARFYRSLLFLSIQDYQRGWLDFDARLQLYSPRILQRRLPSAPWSGENLAGKRILLYAEQGL